MRTQFTTRKFIVSRASFTFLALSIAALPYSVYAQDKEPEAKSYRDRVCDFAILSDGTRLTGIAVNDSPARLVLRNGPSCPGLDL